MVKKNKPTFEATADATVTAGMERSTTEVAHDTGLPYSNASQQQITKSETQSIFKQVAGGIQNKLITDTNKKLDTQGVTGTLNYGGYFAEEYLNTIKGRGGVLVYDEMRRGDYQVAAVLRNIFSRIKGAHFYFEAQEAGDAEGLKQAELLNYCFFESLPKTWKDTLQDVLGFLTFGFAVFEPTFKAEKHADFGNIWSIKSLGYRSPKTIWRWIIKDDKLFTLEQIAWGDDSIMTQIAGDDLIIFTNDREGNNFEGISILRSAYGAWFRKQLYHTINGIGIERSSIGVVDIQIPPEKIGTEEESNMDAAMVNFLMGNTPYLKRPVGWDLKITKNEYDSEAVQKAIRMEDANIAKSVMAEFIELGLTDTGTQALSQSKIENFVKSLIYISAVICDGFKPLAKKLIQFNMGDDAKLKAKMRVVGLDETAGVELAQAFDYLVKAGLMDADETNKEHIRKLYKLPERAKETAVAEAGNAATGDITAKDNSIDTNKDREKPTVELPAVEKGIQQDKNEIAQETKKGDGDNSDTLHKHISIQAPHNQSPLKNKIVKANEHDCAQHLTDTPRRAARPYEKKVKFAEVEKRFKDNNIIITQTIQDSLKVIFAKYKNDLKNALNYARNEKEKYSAVSKLRLGYSGKFTSNLEKVLYAAVLAGRNGAGEEMNSNKKALAEASGQVYQMAIPLTKDLPAGIYGWVKANAVVIAEAQMTGFKNKITLGAIQSLDNNRSDNEILSDVTDKAEKWIADGTLLGAGIIAQKAENEGRFSMFQDYKTEIQGFEFSAMLENSCDLCAELDSLTFSIDDADSVEYTPPLHPNCQCIIIPIMADEATPDEWDGLDTGAEQFSPDELSKLKSLKEVIK